MMSTILRISAVAVALIASSPVLAQETTTEPAVTQPAGDERNDGFDWGLLGLLGLAGLAGLKGRQRDTTTTTSKRL